MKVLVGSLRTTPIASLTQAHTIFRTIFEDSLPPGFDCHQVDVFLQGYTAYTAHLAKDEVVNMENKLGELFHELDPEVEEMGCQHRHSEGPTTYQVSVKIRRCHFRPHRAAWQ